MRGERDQRDLALAACRLGEAAARREGAAFWQAIEPRRRAGDRFEPLAALSAVNGLGQ